MCLSPCSEDGRGEGDVAVAAGEQGEESAGLHDDEQSGSKRKKISAVEAGVNGSGGLLKIIKKC